MKKLLSINLHAQKLGVIIIYNKQLYYINISNALQGLHYFSKSFVITAIFLLNISHFQSIALNVINLTYIYYNKLNYLINKKIHKISRSINHTFKMILFFQVQYHELWFFNKNDS